MNIDSCDTTVWIVFANGKDAATLTPSPRMDQEVYLYNTDTSIITDRIGGITITNVIGRIIKANNILKLYMSESLMERRSNVKGAALNIAVEECRSYLGFKNTHELSQQKIVRQI